MVEKKRIHSDIIYLTTIDPPRNYQHLDSLKNVANYIITEFQKAGLDTEKQKFSAKNNEYENIIASYGIDKTKRLIVGAHYDVAGNHPGADDNASAVAGLIELARLLGKNKPNLEYRIDFVAYCLEEPPFYGSKYMGSAIHAKSLKESNRNIIGMICLEMIGYFSTESNSQKKLPSKSDIDFSDIGDFIVLVGLENQGIFVKNIYESMTENSNINVKTAIFQRNNGFAAFSDHRNYWKQGYNAVMVNDTAFLRNPNYHTDQDTIETLDFDKMSEVIKGTYYAIINMENMLNIL